MKLEILPVGEEGLTVSEIVRWSDLFFTGLAKAVTKEARKYSRPSRFSSFSSAAKPAQSRHLILSLCRHLSRVSALY